MHEEISKLRAGLEAVLADVSEKFSHLLPDQINWKPSPESWSIGQCLDHLNISCAEMVEHIQAKLADPKPASIFEKLPVLPGVFGKLVVNAVSPNTVRKSKTPGIFAPAQSSVAADVVKTFLDIHDKAAAAMDTSGTVDVEKTIMTSPVAKFVTYSMLDGFRIIVYHAQRHVAQARRVMDVEGFPR